MTRSVLVFVLAASAFAQQTIDTARSTITIHVGRAGLLSSAGHEHWVAAAVSSGRIRESPPSVEFTVETANMKVKPDPKVNAKDQAQIQKDMEEMTLDTAKYPRIEFHSTSIEKSGDAEWKVTGDLSLHGVTRPVTLNVKRDGGAYVAHTMLKQTDYGIK